MGITNAKNKKIRTVKPLLVIEPNLNRIDYKAKAVAAEPTGTGNTLCLDTLFGRLFRADEKFVEKCLLEYQGEYEHACKIMNEDLEMQRQKGKDPPLPTCYLVMSYNELYEKLKLIPSAIGDDWGYTNSEDYQVDLFFEYYLHTNDDYTLKYGEPVFTFSPCVGAYPDPCYLDV